MREIQAERVSPSFLIEKAAPGKWNVIHHSGFYMTSGYSQVGRAIRRSRLLVTSIRW